MTAPDAASTAYGYRDDPAVPAFPDDRPLIVFDGVCVLCSGFVRFVHRRDAPGRFRFATAQSDLGQTLYRHYRLDPEDLDTILVLADGELHTKLGAAALVVARLGGIWRLAGLARLLPRPLGNWAYDLVARNRYRLFGRRDECLVPDEALKARFID